MNKQTYKAEFRRLTEVWKRTGKVNGTGKASWKTAFKAIAAAARKKAGGSKSAKKKASPKRKPARKSPKRKPARKTARKKTTRKKACKCSTTQKKVKRGGRTMIQTITLCPVV